MIFITAGAVVVLLVLWVVSCRRRLVAMNENINDAMAQIGVQVSSRFDVLTVLLYLTKRYADDEAQTLIGTVRSRRSTITAISTPNDVLEQEEIIAGILERIFEMAERYPDLKVDENYVKYMNAVDSYEKMVGTSRLIYNDSVTKLNRELRMFPTSLIARVFGFRQRDYLEVVEEEAKYPT